MIVLPHDTYGRDKGLFIEERLPFILGNNIGGVVEKLGEGVTSFTPGDQVFGQGDPLYPTPDASGLQEYAIIEADAAAKIPPGFTMDDLVTFPINATTAFEAMFHSRGFGFPTPSNDANPSPENFVPASKTIVVIGGGSNVGRLGIQFAKIAGIGRIITVASARNEAALRAMGATHIVDRHASPESIAAQIREISPAGVEHVFDCVSWENELSLALSIVPTTQPSVVLTLHPPNEGIKLAKEKGLNDCSVRFILGTNDYLQPLTKQLWVNLPKWVEQGKIRVPKYRVIEGLDLKLVEEGLDSYRDGSPVTQFIVHPHGGK
jgi:NADPH:quinone reductase